MGTILQLYFALILAMAFVFIIIFVVSHKYFYHNGTKYDLFSILPLELCKGSHLVEPHVLQTLLCFQGVAPFEGLDRNAVQQQDRVSQQSSNAVAHSGCATSESTCAGSLSKSNIRSHLFCLSHSLSHPAVYVIVI